MMEMDAMHVLGTVIGVLVLFIFKHFLNKRTRPSTLPPGPKRLPFIGNLLDLPRGDLDWIHWARHKHLYGPISSVTVFGQQIVVLNDMDLVTELLDRKSSVFSDRPTMVFSGQMCGWDRALGMMHYGPRHKEIRKILHQFIGSGDAVARHHPIIEVEARRFLLRILRSPCKFADHIRKLSGAIILKLSHGYTVEPEKSDPLVKLGDDALHDFSVSAQAGTWFVDILPFLQYVPEWLPGAGFKRIAKKIRANGDEMADKPLAFVKMQMITGQYYPSLASDLIEEGTHTADNEHNIKWSSAAVYGGGADTTVSAKYSFFLAMTLHPDVQRRAQEELDRAVGAERLPAFSDRKNLPYIDALIKETLRWHPVVPLSVPHGSSEEFVVRGYTILKGTIVLPNIWLFTRDPARHSEPDNFRPERFLGDHPEPDSYGSAFGFGRRICPGKELADAILFIFAAQTLAAFTIEKARNADGEEIEPAEDYTNGVISRPKDFVCSIKPRSDKTVELIKAVEEEHPFEPSHSSELLNLDWKRT
ncbi:cytochrome P450 [Schizopora paradoxa]|uniref:Cytochrome P450 n=1 Tax=Schizopora paradoxa TaxID=27342 RepID=A0A0H2QXZ3_9AGAM|nr:cytochrome P450 [Schizopora paradoxa]